MVNRGITVLCLASSPVFAEPLTLNWPLDCRLNETCYIQQYMDVDDSAAVRDFHGGQASYEGHKGTDIRLPSQQKMQDGVNVLASAAGRVMGVRNGMVDRLVQTDADRAAIKGKDCGNGVVIAHEGGWETQYCHMKQSSITVTKGQIVAARDILGQVGLSGRTQFPHLHISVRKDGQKIDPFTPGANLWAAILQPGLAYQPTQIINLGFADGAVKMADITLDKYAKFAPSQDTIALVTYVRAINLAKGDQVRLTLTGPTGQIISNTYDPVGKTKAQQMYFTGKKRPIKGWPKGVYQAKAQILRNGVVVDGETRAITAK